MSIMDELQAQSFSLEFSRNELNTESNREYYSYTFTDTRANVAFCGNDYSPSPLFGTEEEKIIGLLEFLVLEPRNDADENFENYTTAQLSWAKSHRRQDLAYIVWEFDDKIRKTKLVSNMGRK